MELSEIIASAAGTRRVLAEAIAAVAPAVTALARDVHAHPETAFLERETTRKVQRFLLAHGFEVTSGVGRVPTAFTATVGSGEIVVGLCVEYDALPGIGHACGHHLILGAGLVAAIALRDVVDELGITVKVIGCPAEEHGGGKIYLLQDGAFDDVHCALMIHPVSDGLDGRPTGTTSQAVGRWRATYTGKASHAAFAPHLGINAADAVVVAQVALGLLRQQIPSDHRANMVIKEAGQVTNIICEHSVVEFEARAFTLAEFDALYERVVKCFEAGAVATGCELMIEAVEPPYEPLLHDSDLSAHWCAAWGALGRQVAEPGKLSGGSTDFGNVSQILPGLHPWVSIPGVSASIHAADFAAAADTPVAYETMLEAGVAMAWTIAGLMQDADAVGRLYQRKATRVDVPITQIPGENELAALTQITAPE